MESRFKERDEIIKNDWGGGLIGKRMEIDDVIFNEKGIKNEMKKMVSVIGREKKSKRKGNKEKILNKILRF